MVQAKLLSQFSQLRAYFFEKSDSSQLDRYGIDMTKLISCEQIHGSKVAVVGSNRNRNYLGYDGLLTGRGFFLNIRTADCLPIFLYDAKINVIAAIHAGWRGLLFGIIDNTVTAMKKLGCQVKDIYVGIGPHIKVCCYSVSKARWSKFQNFLKSDQTIGQHRKSAWYLDLEKVALISLSKNGLLKENMEVLPYCTFCDGRFFSWRRDGAGAGRMVNVLGRVSNKI